MRAGIGRQGRVTLNEVVLGFGCYTAAWGV
jgi:hypothetical protein